MSTGQNPKSESPMPYNPVHPGRSVLPSPAALPESTSRFLVLSELPQHCTPFCLHFLSGGSPLHPLESAKVATPPFAFLLTLFSLQLLSVFKFTYLEGRGIPLLQTISPSSSSLKKVPSPLTSPPHVSCCDHGGKLPSLTESWGPSFSFCARALGSSRGVASCT